jgi:hypothetical protein
VELIAPISSLSSAFRSGNLSAEDDQVDLVHIEAARDIGEVVGRLDPVTEVAQARDGFVEDELALADQQHAALGAVGDHVGSLRSRRGNAATSISCRRNEFGVVVRARECLSGLFP